MLSKRLLKGLVEAGCALGNQRTGPKVLRSVGIGGIGETQGSPGSFVSEIMWCKIKLEEWPESRRAGTCFPLEKSEYYLKKKKMGPERPEREE